MSEVQTARAAKVAPKKVQSALSQGDQQRLFEALDLLQKQHAESDQRTSSVLDAASREDQMVDRLRQLKQAQGETVSEEELRAAVRATREPTNLVYQPSPEGVVRTLGNVYLARARWLPPSIAAVVAASLLWGGVSLTQHVRQKNFEEAVATTTQSLHNMETRRRALDGVAGQWPAGIGQAAHRAAFERALALSDSTIAAAQSALSHPSRQALAEVDKDLSVSSQALASAAAAQSGSQTQAQFVARAAELARLPDDATWPEANTRRRARLNELSAALASGDIVQARQSIAAVDALSNAASVRSTLREAASLVPPEAQGEAQALRTRGEAALLAADTAGAAASLTGLRNLTDMVASSYTMKIVNEEGVKSGVWRYPNDNPSARNYYIVVDALDAAGNPVKVPVVNEETGHTETVSRFAVRVAEAVYEKVKADKMDNGLIDDAVVGVKRAGKMKPEYTVDTAGGGVITDW